MKKIQTYVIISILIISSLSLIATIGAGNQTNHHLHDKILLSPVTFTEKNNYVQLEIKETNSLLLSQGKPQLPIISKTYTFPVGTKILDTQITYDHISLTLPKKIQPTPPINTYTKTNQAQPTEKTMIPQLYQDITIYPATPYTITKTVGQRNGEHLLFVSLQMTPQYIPSQDIVSIPTNIQVDIYYELPQQPLFTADEYDLLIITDESFTTALQPLVTHKTNIGIRTLMETTQTIYQDYDGRDEPEDIKLFIKDSYEAYGIDYVLLAGGRKGQTFDWYIPTRDSNNFDDEIGYASDLYYGDLYKVVENETVFEDWDSNGNDIFAEWIGIQKDVIDYNPDVSIGRLPFRSSSEIDYVIQRIITYETANDMSWFTHGIVISGDTGPPCRGPATPGLYEGEMTTAISANLLESIGFTVDRLWLSEGAWSGRSDVIAAISGGAGMIHMAGHGNPAYWGNFLPDAQSEEEMVDGLLLRDMFRLKNGEKLPVIVVGGCHNAQFNVTFKNFIEGIKEYGISGMFFEPPYKFYYKEWVPRDFCTGLVFARRGGAIASIGCSGLGLGYFDAIGLGDRLDVQFFDAYADQEIDVLGQTHDQAIRDYITIYGDPNTSKSDRKTVEEWTLIGDPSLKIGGYP